MAGGEGSAALFVYEPMQHGEAGFGGEAAPPVRGQDPVAKIDNAGFIILAAAGEADEFAAEVNAEAAALAFGAAGRALGLDRKSVV